MRVIQLKQTLATALVTGVLFFQTGRLEALIFTGTNQPGTTQDYPFVVESGTTNLAISVNGTGSAFSHLLLKSGSIAGEADFDFVAVRNSDTNFINLEFPELAVTNYVLRVSTPAGSQAHAFTVTITNNVTDLRTASRPATKRISSLTTGVISSGTWHYYRVDIPTNISAWRVILSSPTVAPNLYIHRDGLPTSTGSLKSSTGTTNDVIVFTPGELLPGTYYIGVNQVSGTTGYTLKTEPINFVQLSWDPGTTHIGTLVHSVQDTNGGDYYFRINVQNTAVGAWRNALTVSAGEADLFLAKGAAPTPAAYAYKSERVGSDGFVLPSTAFNAGEDWYLLVRSTAGAQWDLVSGEAFVMDLGVVTEDGSSGSGAIQVGAEGMRLFRTTSADSQSAWRLWLNGATNSILVRKSAAALPGFADFSQTRQMLLVPSYLVGGQLYFVSVVGAPGTPVDLDSRIHPYFDLPFAGSTNINVTGFPYATFRVQVPADPLAWQVSVLPETGNPNICLRRDSIPNEANNSAYSEVPGSVADSVTLVPDTLSDGTFFITVYSTNNYSCTLVSGLPQVEEIGYIDAVTNSDTNRVGWRIFKVSDIASQLVSLGWDLNVSNASPGTRIALRRNRAPGIWNFRNPTAGTAGFYNELSAGSSLQAPDNQADVWYVGVYNPSNALGNFTLHTGDLVPETMSFNSGLTARADVPAGKWQFFRIDVPTNALGWDIRLTNVLSGSPQLVVRRERLPISLASIGMNFLATNWPGAGQWAAGGDWTGRSFSPDGTVSESGRVITAGIGRPLQPGTYYVGVLNHASSTEPMSYSVLSRGIGPGLDIPIVDIAYTNGSVTNLNLAARDIAVYRVAVPSNAPSWKLKLEPTSGDALMAISRGSIPNVRATTSGSVTNALTAGRKMQKSTTSGNEHHLQLPFGLSKLIPGDYYIVVASEGQSDPGSTTRIGTGNAGYVLTSVGSLSEIFLGVLEEEDLVYNGTLEGGESAVFRFENLEDTLGFELTQEEKTGNPWMVSSLYPGVLPNPGSPNPADTYGNEGGLDGLTSPDIITVSGIFPVEYIGIKARGSGMNYPDATYQLRVRKLTADPLPFDGGVAEISGQTNIYHFFRVDVPEDALGWDIRITNVLSGNPLLVVSRDYLALDIPPAGWSPGRAEYWPPAGNWIAAKDWTQRSLSSSGQDEDGRILAMGMGLPLEPGTYYIGVKGGSPATPMSYTIVSRGIGTGFSIPVVEIPFSGGAVVNEALAPREAAYYRVVVPSDASSWRARLTMTSGEGMLVALTNWLPNVLSPQSSGLGKGMQKADNEQYLLLPGHNQWVLPPGTNYLAVVSEGQGVASGRIGTGFSSYVLETLGSLAPINLGLAGAEVLHTNSLQAGEVCAYQFTVPPDTTSVEVELLNRVGNPAMVLRVGAAFPNPGAASSPQGPGGVSADSYGHEGGWNLSAGAGNANSSLITVANPAEGVYTVMVKARPIGTTHTNALFTLAVRATSVSQVAFDGGARSVTNQNAGSWRYFQFTVPTNAAGWDLRLVNVSGGIPKLVLRRDALPGSLTTGSWSTPGYTTEWPGTSQWAAAADWTRRSSSAANVNEEGRLLAMGMGQPLEPGTYFAGVFNSTTSNSLTYTVLSRGIGEGTSIPVISLPFSGGSHTNTSLLPREAAYYRIDIPAGVKGWKVRLTSVSGEALLLSLKDVVPNVDTGRSTSAARAGKVMQKAGNEHFVVLPGSGQSNLVAGTYYLAVVGEGLNPASSSRVGTGSTSYEIVSEGEINVLDMGAVGGPDLVRAETLQGGESAFYRFTVPAGTLALEMRLENRVGSPVAVMTTNSLVPDPGGMVQGQREAYGNEGGASPAFVDSDLITLPNPGPGVYYLAVKARASSGSTFPDAAYTLRVRHLAVTDLSFSAELNTNGVVNSASALLLDQQRAYYRVVVPTNINDQPVIGWELNVSAISGVAAIRVRKDLLPSERFASGMPLTSKAVVVVPPYLTPGTWFVEVCATNSTSFNLVSANLTLQRPAWEMPQTGEPVATPGVLAPDFGDTGVDTNGAALAGDQGVELEAGRYHFYAVNVPETNAGLMRMQLTAISGNPDLYIRAHLAPTLSHRTNGSAGSLLDRALSGSTTDYGNWVPLSVASESSLTPGMWYVAVRASLAANARYRLKLGLGAIQDLDLATGSVAGHAVASNDWRYYRFQVPPEAPENWHLNFSQQSGDVVMHLRDTAPPGNGANNLAASVRDWSTDSRSSGMAGSYDAAGSYTFRIPPLRPGTTYYVGFRGKVDSVFSFSSSVSGSTLEVPPEIAFYGGSVTNWMPPNGTLIYRVLTPDDALRWRHTSIHNTAVQVFIKNGTMPARSASDDFRSTSANSGSSQYLMSYPWLPLQTYYVVVTNTSATSQPFSLTMNGSNITADDDSDGMPDLWELQYFGSIAPNGNADYDADGVSNLNEYVENTNPTDKTSLRPRLVVLATNGVVNVEPLASNYTSGASVILAATPDSGFLFTGWSGTFNTQDNPLTVVLTSNVTLTAKFRVPGDDFEQRIVLAGLNPAGAPLSNAGATKQPGENAHAGNAGGRSLWWTWTAPESGMTRVSTVDASFRTLLAAYVGGSVSQLSAVASSAAGADTNNTSMSFDATAGTTYHFAVDGFGGASGVVSVSVSLVGTAINLVEPLRAPGEFRFKILSGAGSVLQLQSSTNLVNWSALGTITNHSGNVQFIDTNAPGGPARFYRAVLQ